MPLRIGQEVQKMLLPSLSECENRTSTKRKRVNKKRFSTCRNFYKKNRLDRGFDRLCVVLLLLLPLLCHWYQEQWLYLAGFSCYVIIIERLRSGSALPFGFVGLVLATLFQLSFVENTRSPHERVIVLRAVISISGLILGLVFGAAIDMGSRDR